MEILTTKTELVNWKHLGLRSKKRCITFSVIILLLTFGYEGLHAQSYRDAFGGLDDRGLRFDTSFSRTVFVYAEAGDSIHTMITTGGHRFFHCPDSLNCTPITLEIIAPDGDIYVDSASTTGMSIVTYDSTVVVGATQTGVWQLRLTNNGAIRSGAFDLRFETISSSGNLIRGRSFFDQRLAIEGSISANSNLSDTFYVVSKNGGYLYQARWQGLDPNIGAIGFNTFGNLVPTGDCVNLYSSTRTGTPPAIHTSVCHELGALLTFIGDPRVSGVPESSVIWDDVNGVQNAIELLPIVPTEPIINSLSFESQGSGNQGSFVFDISNFQGNAEIVIDVDRNGSFRDSIDAIVFVGVLESGVGVKDWDGLDGFGNNIPASCEPLNARMLIERAGEIHLQWFDVESMGGVEIIRLNGTNSPSDTIYWNETHPIFDPFIALPTKDGTNGVSSTGFVHSWSQISSVGDRGEIDQWAFNPVEIRSDIVNVNLSATSTFNCVAQLNVSCGDSIEVGDLITTDALAIYHFKLIDEFGGSVPNPIPKGFSGTIWAIVSSDCGNEECEVEITVSDKESCVVRHTLDTTLWCVDDLLDVDPDGAYYRDVLGLRPYAEALCSGDILEVTYEGEWINTFECGDTLKQLIRGWRSETKDGYSCVASDTINVIRLPEISDYIYAPQKDTVLCEYDSTYWYTFKKKHISWKDLVNLHNDGSTVRYPIFDNNFLYRDIEAIYLAWEGISDEDVKDSLRNEYEDCPVILRWNSARGAYDEIDLLEMYEAFLLADVLFDYEMIDGVDYAIWNVKLGDKIMTNGGAYLEVTEDWFYEAGEHGFWIDLAIPEITYERELKVCDQWSAYECHGIQLILPDHPYEPDSCKIFCLDDALDQNKCLDVVYVEEKDLGGSCPRVVKRHTIIKQSCVASPNSIAEIPDNCPLMTDDSGVIRRDNIGGGYHIEVEQWILYIDTLGPLLDEHGIASKELVFQTSTHDCYGEVTLPSIKVKDVCSGVKRVKATVGYNNGWIEFEDADGDGEWKQVSGRNIRLACGESYPVQYELMDSCHNETKLTRHWVGVEDLISPVVLTPDTLNVNLSTKEIWIAAETFDIGSADNCGIARVLVRRPDWITACGVDVCSDALASISSKAELEAYIRANGFFANFNDNAVEQTYAGFYEWLVSDGDWCDRQVSGGVDVWGTSNGGNRKAANSNLKDVLIAGWKNDIYNYWAANCVGTDDHGNSLIDPITDFNIGGGWGQSVPICCEDACKEVVVEVLVIDKSCNYTKGWAVLNVESNQPVVQACEFETLTIGCSAYEQNYASLVEAAQNDEEGAYDALDEALGHLVKGWRPANGAETGDIYDYSGTILNKEITYKTSECKIEVVERKILDTLHDGTVVWETVKEGRQVIEEVEKTADLGGIYQICGASCERSVWVELNECGVGKITRRWDCRPCSGGADVQGTSEGDNRIADVHDQVLSISQVIYITSDCELSKYSFNIPNDTMVCADLIYTLDSKVDIDAGELSYALADVDCRQLGITHTDEVFTVVGEPDLRKIHRTWKATDWCNNEEVECVQKIILNTNCDAESKVLATSQKPLERSSEEQDNIGRFQLYQNAPNPFTESTVIRFELPEATKAKLSIYDLTGRVLYIQEGDYESGLNQVLIENSDLSDKQQSGVLILQLETATHIATKQLVISK